MTTIDVFALAKTHKAVSMLLSRTQLAYESTCPLAGTAVATDGRLTTYVGPLFVQAPVAIQAEILKHELAHIIGHFWPRLAALPNQPADLNRFNVAHDAVIHEVGCCDIARIEQATGIQGVTCERLGVEPSPAEDIYEILQQRQQHQGAGCGRGQFLKQMIQSGKASTLEVPLSEIWQATAGAYLTAGSHAASPRALVGTLPPTPPWARQLRQYLEDWCSDNYTPERSWRRGPSRRYPSVLLPGWPRVKPDCSALIFLDASGSMDDAVLLQAVAACQSVGLSVTVRIWSTFVSEQLPPEPEVLRTEIGKHRGGTLAQHCARIIAKERCVIWISDAESMDGLPDPRKGWTWVVLRNTQEPIFTTHPQA